MKKWIPQLCNLPSLQKSLARSKNEIINSPTKIAAKNKILQYKLQNMKKLLKQKRAIKTSMKKINITKLICIPFLKRPSF